MRKSLLGFVSRPGLGEGLAVTAALAVWGVSLGAADPNRMTDVGLVSVLPPTFYAALAILGLSFCVALWRESTPAPVLFLHIAALIVMVHATPTATEGTLRYYWAWKHVGLVDYIQRHGSVDPNIPYLTAYHNWPGFFALAALLTEAAGLPNALPLAIWGPVVFNLLFLTALVPVFQALSRDRRLVWLSAWFFFLANWVGQDYFSPQALAYFLYLVVLGLCLTWFRSAAPAQLRVRWWVPTAPAVWIYNWLVRRTAGGEGPVRTAAPAQMVGLLGLVILLLVGIVSSHQLTPFMVLLGLAALVALRRCTAAGLPLLLGVLTAAWIVFMASGFLSANLYWVIESIGQLGQNARSTLIDLERVSPGQRLVAVVDRVLTAGMCALAGLGLLRRVRHGRWDLTVGLLAAAPAPMLVANAYGGEMLFRVYFFALPMLALLAAAVVFPTPSAGHGWLAFGGTVLLSGLLMAGLMLAYYGKEQMYYYAPDEVAAAEYLYDVAPPGSLFVGLTYFPWAFRDYEQYTYRSLVEESVTTRRRLDEDPAALLARVLEDERFPAVYVSISRNQRAVVEGLGLLSPGGVDRARQALVEPGRYRVLLDSPAATIVTRAPT